MERLAPSTKIYLADSKIPKAGRGVFAAEAIAEGEVIETCPVILLPESQTDTFHQTDLVKYYFMWGKDLELVALALGYGALYNHSFEPNATYKKKLETDTLDFVAIKPIVKDVEITVNYNYSDPNDKSPIWISDIPPAK